MTKELGQNPEQIVQERTWKKENPVKSTQNHWKTEAKPIEEEPTVGNFEVPGRIAGRTVQFLSDTGASVSFINKDVF